MTVKISQLPQLQQFFREASGLDNNAGDPRRKQIVLRLLQEVARVIEDLQISDDEFWGAVDLSLIHI